LVFLHFISNNFCNFSIYFYFFCLCLFLHRGGLFELGLELVGLAPLFLCLPYYS
jgi:hypothetical protein